MAKLYDPQIFMIRWRHKVPMTTLEHLTVLFNKQKRMAVSEIQKKFEIHSRGLILEIIFTTVFAHNFETFFLNIKTFKMIKITKYLYSMLSCEFFEVLTSTELWKLSAWEQFTQNYSKVGEIWGAGRNSVIYGR